MLKKTESLTALIIEWEKTIRENAAEVRPIFSASQLWSAESAAVKGESEGSCAWVDDFSFNAFSGFEPFFPLFHSNELKAAYQQGIFMRKPKGIKVVKMRKIAHFQMWSNFIGVVRGFALAGQSLLLQNRACIQWNRALLWILLKVNPEFEHYQVDFGDL